MKAFLKAEKGFARFEWAEVVVRKLEKEGFCLSLVSGLATTSTLGLTTLLFSFFFDGFGSWATGAEGGGGAPLGAFARPDWCWDLYQLTQSFIGYDPIY